jgi:cytochrome c oxidase subunit 4
MADHGHAHAVDHGDHKPKTRIYLIIAFILAVITAVEVYVYYVPGLPEKPIFIPMLLAMSAVKFALVVGFYMHLKYDHKIFRGLFVGPFIIALGTIIALIFLFAYEAK